MKTETVKFEVGKTYATRSICNHDCIFDYTILRRTEKTVTIVDLYGDTVRKKVSVYNGVEQFLPHGRYSMAPIISADTELDAV